MNRDRDHDTRQTSSRQPDDTSRDGARVSATMVLDEIIRHTPRDDDRLNYLLLLRKKLEADETRVDEAKRVIAEYEEAYRKLTSPANRLGVYLGSGEEPGTALIAVGDQEFLASVDPRLGGVDLSVGQRVRVNEAFAVVGEMGCHPGGPLVKIAEVLDSERLRVTADPQGQQGRIVFRGAQLKDTELKAGDEVRVDPTFRVALEYFPGKDTREYFLEEVPELPWDKIGGQHDAIRVIKDAIELPLLHPELYARFEKRPLKGILLYGPPGCGKTLIGKATAYNLTREYRERTQRDVKEFFMYISGPKILNMWLGETERMVRELFATARQKAKEGHLVFLFIDEAESVLRTRSSGRFLNISNTVVPQFCAEMDGLVSLENVVVMLTSNRPDYIDPAILRPERIDRKVRVARPDRKDTRDIFSIYLHGGVPLDPCLVRDHKGDQEAARDEILDLAVECLWRKEPETEFLDVYLRSGAVETLHWRDLVSGALVKSVVERAKDFAIKRSIERASSSEGLSVDDLRQAIRVEYKENEIFPKSDTQEDWLKLLDYDPENVATVKPIRGKRQPTASRKNII